MNPLSRDQKAGREIYDHDDRSCTAKFALKFKQDQSKPNQDPTPASIHGDQDPQSFSNHMSSVKNQTGKLGSQSDSKTHNNALGTTPGKKLSEEQEPPKIEILEKND